MQDLIFETQDGSHSIMSAQHGVSYHSKYGAVQESRHVFIQAGLYQKALQQKDIRILEFGFGSGLNAFLSLLETQQHDWKIRYEAVEAYPILPEQARLLNYPTLLEANHLQAAFLKMHECPWGQEVEITPSFVLKKWLQRFEDISFQNQFDVIYFDAFAPDAQPELWELPVLEKAYEALCTGGLLVTYCAKGSVKRALKSAGFQLESLPGPPGKREMTRCIKI